MPKAIVCACEDVTRVDLARAFAAGHRDLESVKRYTGLGTGPCQGKSCLAVVTRELLRLGATPDEVAPFTVRPPLQPTSLAALAALDPGGLPLDGPPALAPPLPGPAARQPLPERARVVIVGGGIMGLGLAWNLCRRGETDVVVLERSYLNAGASGRNGGGVRAQWSTPTLIRLGRRSLELCRSFAVELGINVWFRRGGYLFLAPDAAQAARAERSVRLHQQHGLRTRLLSPGEAQALVPELDPRRFAAASWNPDDGVVFPWPFLWGYAAGAEALGARVCTFTRVLGLEGTGRRLTAVVTDRGRIQAGTVVNAAGAWGGEVAALAGVRLPTWPVRHEILVTDAWKAWLGPLVSVLGSGLYFSQSLRGELVGGLGDPGERPGLQAGSSLRFAARFARALVEVLPAAGALHMVRQWAGCYDLTPDNGPILGPAGFDNFQQLVGFVGHGFMMAPAVTELLAASMTGQPPDEIFERFTVERSARPDLVREDWIIG